MIRHALLETQDKSLLFNNFPLTLPPHHRNTIFDFPNSFLREEKTFGPNFSNMELRNHPNS